MELCDGNLKEYINLKKKAEIEKLDISEEEKKKRLREPKKLDEKESKKLISILSNAIKDLYCIEKIRHRDIKLEVKKSFFFLF